MSPTHAASRRVVARRSAQSRGTGATKTRNPRSIGGKASHIRAAEIECGGGQLHPGGG